MAEKWRLMYWELFQDDEPRSAETKAAYLQEVSDETKDLVEDLGVPVRINATADLTGDVIHWYPLWEVLQALLDEIKELKDRVYALEHP